MSFKSKLAEHIAAAEKWQGRVIGFEKAAERITDDPVGQNNLLSARVDYRSAVSNRNGHQQQAIMYGIAAILEEFGRQRTERQMESPRQAFSSPPPGDGHVCAQFCPEHG